jgi:hypothetical protein
MLKKWAAGCYSAFGAILIWHTMLAFAETPARTDPAKFGIYAILLGGLIGSVCESFEFGVRYYLSRPNPPCPYSRIRFFGFSLISTAFAVAFIAFEMWYDDRWRYLSPY